MNDTDGMILMIIVVIILAAAICLFFYFMDDDRPRLSDWEFRTVWQDPDCR